MKHKKYLWIIIFLLMLDIVISYDPFDNNNIGYDYVNNQDSTNKAYVESNYVELQEQNGQDDTQISLKDQANELQKDILMDNASNMWDLILGLFKILIELLTLLYYIIEMRLVLYVFFQLIPMVFTKLRDGLVNFYVVRVKR